LKPTDDRIVKLEKQNTDLQIKVNNLSSRKEMLSFINLLNEQMKNDEERVAELDKKTQNKMAELDKKINDKSKQSAANTSNIPRAICINCLQNVAGNSEHYDMCRTVCDGVL
jgi:predicted  nucleic acid-binding Zn-ribbon protein